LATYVVAERHEYRFSVPGNRYSARALSGRNRRDGFHLVGVDDGDGIALFVRNEGEKGRSGISPEQQERDPEASERGSCDSGHDEFSFRGDRGSLLALAREKAAQ
jgi:hypothetical protein